MLDGANRLNGQSLVSRLTDIVASARAEEKSDEYIVLALLEKLRHPTVKMMIAGAKKPEVPDPDLRPGTADCDVNAIQPTARMLDETSRKPNISATILRYQAMIDAALAED